MMRQLFSDLMREPGAIFTILVSFGLAILVSKKSSSLVQSLMSGFSLLYILTYWQQGDRVSLGMMWMYAGWAGFVSDKIGFWDAVASLTESLKNTLRSGASMKGILQRRPFLSPHVPNEPSSQYSNKRVEQFQQEQASFDERQQQRDLQRNSEVAREARSSSDTHFQ